MIATHTSSARSGRSAALSTSAWIRVAALSGLLGVGIGTAKADSLIPPGKPAPDLALSALTGETVRLADLKGRPVLLLFGELYNPNSIAACRDIAAVLARPGLANIGASAFLIVTQRAPAADLLAEAKRKGVTLPILHDEGRRTFAAYRVMVLPSLVVVDGQGLTVLPCAGYPLDFQDLIVDALLYAGGKLSPADYSRRRTAPSPAATATVNVRAARLAALGEHLARRGSVELAIDRLKEAIALDPNCVPARIVLATCLLNRGELATAEEHFLHVLGTNADSVEANLGLIHIQVVRGGSELESAADRLRALLHQHPNDPKVVYLAGLVAEKSGDADGALRHYKRAAELLLYGHVRKRELK